MTEEVVDPDTQKWVLLWVCYSVHHSGPVLEVLKSKYPNLILLFVPASCTAELQPLDLSYNFVFKSGVASLFVSWLSRVAQEQLLYHKTNLGLALVKCQDSCRKMGLHEAEKNLRNQEVCHG